MKLLEPLSAKEAVIKQMRETDRQIESLLDRIVEASTPSVVNAYEARIEKLER
jgi:site-specific DNA recombinase